MAEYIVNFESEDVFKSQFRKFFWGTVCSYIAGIIGAVVLSSAVIAKSGSDAVDAAVNLLINTLPVYIAPLIIYPFFLKSTVFTNERVKEYLSSGEFVFIVAGSMGCSHIISIVTEKMIRLIEGNSQNLVEDVSGSMPLWITILLMGILFPIIEEIVFRKVLLLRLRGMGDLTAVILSAMAFSFYHANLYQLFYTFFLGLILGILVVKTGFLRYGILIHVILNSLNLFFAGLNNEWLWDIFSKTEIVLGIFAIIMMIVFRKKINCGFREAFISERQKLKMCVKTVSFWIFIGIIFLLSSCVTFMG